MNRSSRRQAARLSKQTATGKAVNEASSVSATLRSPLTVSLAVGLLSLSAAGWAQAQNTTQDPPQKQDSQASEQSKKGSGAAPNTTLKEVKVTDTRTRENEGYNPGTTNIGKTNQALKDIPQSVTVIPEQLMHDRGADTFKEALRNVAGLTFNAGEGGRVGDNITLRGFSVVGDLYLDGIRDIAQYNRETFNLESIDVMRGSASMLFGRGSAGGVINQVSKTPYRYQPNEVTATIGTDGYKRITTDLTKAFSDDTILRINALGHDANSFRDEVYQKRVGFAPSIVFGAGLPQTLTLSYYYLKERNLPDYGVPYLATTPGAVARPLAVPVSTFYGLANADYERNEAQIGTLTYKHQFSKDNQLKTVLRVAKYERDLWVTAPRLPAGTTALTDTTLVNRGRPARGGQEDTVTSQTDWTFKANWLGMQHEVLVGMELAREKSERWTNSNGLMNPPTATSQLANPATNALQPNARPDLPAGYFSTQFRYNPNSYVANTAGLYAQDTVQIAKHWKLVGGVRFDDFKSDYERTAPLGPLTRKDQVWSKKLGVMFQPDTDTTYYASWGTSFNPSGELYQLDDRSQNTPPELNRNLEIGAKWDLLDGDLSLRTALYRTQKTNERNTDVNNASVYLLSGKRHTDGIEFEVAGRITTQWEIFGALALQNAKIDVASGQQANTLGKVPTNTPKHTFSVWTTYRIDSRWKVGGGVESVGERFSSNANTAVLPGYNRVDAMVEYKFEPFAVQLNLKNLLNKDYYEGVYTAHTVPGTKRAATLAVSYKF